MLKTINDGRKLLANFDVLAQAPEGVAKLRELILTLAVQGKLVTQEAVDSFENNSDEANESSAPYLLPNSWRWVQLGSVTRNMGSGWSPACINQPRDSEDLWAVLKTTAVQINKFQPEENKLLPSNLEPRPDIEVKEGDVLITRAGPMNRVGICCYVDSPFSRLMLSDKIVRFSPDLNILNPEFLMICLNSGWTKTLIENSKSGMAASQVNISQKNIKELWVPVCSLEEQSRIVARVESLMQLCDALEAKGELEASQHQQLLQALLGSLTQSADADELAHNWQRVAAHFDLLLDRPEAIDALEQTILQLAVRGLLVPQDQNDETAILLLNKIKEEKNNFLKKKKSKKTDRLDIDVFKYNLPKNWVWTVLEEVALVGPENGLSPKPSNSETQYKCLTLTSTTSGVFKSNFFKHVDISDKEAEANYLKNNDLLIQRGNSIDYVGIAAIYDGQDNEFIYPDLMMRLRLSSQVNLKYVHLALISKDGRDYFKSVATGTQGNMPKVNQTAVNSAPIPLPPLAEQSRIVARVNELRALCQQLREQLSQARHTQSLLAQAWVEQAAA